MYLETMQTTYRRWISGRWKELVLRWHNIEMVLSTHVDHGLLLLLLTRHTGICSTLAWHTGIIDAATLTRHMLLMWRWMLLILYLHRWIVHRWHWRFDRLRCMLHLGWLLHRQSTNARHCSRIHRSIVFPFVLILKKKKITKRKMQNIINRINFAKSNQRIHIKCLPQKQKKTKNRHKHTK